MDLASLTLWGRIVWANEKFWRFGYEARIGSNWDAVRRLELLVCLSDRVVRGVAGNLMGP